MFFFVKKKLKEKYLPSIYSNVSGQKVVTQNSQIDCFWTLRNDNLLNIINGDSLLNVNTNKVQFTTNEITSILTT